MRQGRRISGGRAAGLVAVGLACAIAASLTRPFTWQADLVTALPLTCAFIATVVRITTAGARQAAGGVDSPGVAQAHWGARWLAWPALAAAVAGWELYSYASASREAHPTLSTLIDLATSTPPGKAVTFAAWLLLGWYLVTR